MLLHICCSNCALGPVPAFRDRGIEPTGLWFNPNIHPFSEYRARRDSLRGLVKLWNLDLIEVDDYGLVSFLRAVAGREDDRCEVCYRMRLEETARRAAEGGFTIFSTTLLISPYQDHDLIRAVGREAEKRHGVEFHYEDFTSHFRESRRRSRELDLYRQKYCGCIFSEMERYLGRDSVRTAVKEAHGT